MSEDKQFDENWIKVQDRLPGPQGHDSEEVQVFINGHVTITDHEGRKGGAWGHSKGFYDAERGAFRVGGAVNYHVTHWQPLPKPPETAIGGYQKLFSPYLTEGEIKALIDLLKPVAADPLSVSALRKLGYVLEDEE